MNKRNIGRESHLPWGRLTSLPRIGLKPDGEALMDSPKKPRVRGLNVVLNIC